MSHTTGVAFPPREAMPDAASSSVLELISIRNTRAFLSANNSAMALPIPLPAPVMTAILLSRLNMIGSVTRMSTEERIPFSLLAQMISQEDRVRWLGRLLADMH